MCDPATVVESKIPSSVIAKFAPDVNVQVYTKDVVSLAFDVVV